MDRHLNPQLSIRIPEFLLEKLREISSKYQVSVTSLVIGCLDYYLSEYVCEIKGELMAKKNKRIAELKAELAKLEGAE